METCVIATVVVAQHKSKMGTWTQWTVSHTKQIPHCLQEVSGCYLPYEVSSYSSSLQFRCYHSEKLVTHFAHFSCRGHTYHPCVRRVHTVSDQSLHAQHWQRKTKAQFAELIWCCKRQEERRGCINSTTQHVCLQSQWLVLTDQIV